MQTERPVIFRWAASSYFGWGVYGLNLMLHWPHPALTGQAIDRVVVNGEDRQQRIARLIQSSRRLHDRLAAFGGQAVVMETPVFVSYGNDLMRYFAVHGVDLFGRPSIGFVFLEDTAIDPANIAAINRLPLVVAGSSWNADVLSGAGVRNVSVVLQGVDHEIFYPRPHSSRKTDRFVIFSGGQCSFRKGQDLVLRAFHAFAQRHPDAILATAWHSPWPDRSQSFAAVPAIAPPPARADGMLDFRGWAARVGIRANQFEEVGSVPNCDLPRILADVDVALFPNRGEGGTNLVAMECLASAIPTILSANTGHLDLVGRTGTFALTRQRPVTSAVPGFRATVGWGESDIDEIVELLEDIYMRREAAGERARRASDAMQMLSWQRQIRELYGIVSQFL